MILNPTTDVISVTGLSRENQRYDDLRELVERQLRGGRERGAGVELALAAGRHVVLPDPVIHCVLHLRRAQRPRQPEAGAPVAFSRTPHRRSLPAP